MRRLMILSCLLLGIWQVSPIIGATKEVPSSWFSEKIALLEKEGQLDGRLYSDYKSFVSRKDFAYLGVRLYELYTGRTSTVGNEKFVDTTDEWILKAKHIGIVSGFPDGSFKPNQPIRRDELAHLFVNVLKIAKATYKAAGSKRFTDDQQIQSWAKMSVYIATENGLINGVGNNQFNPSGNATREEALIIFYRGLHEPAIVPIKAIHINDPKIEAAFLSLKKFWPHIVDLYEQGYLEDVVIEPEKGTVLLRFDNAPLTPNGSIEENLYFAWNMQGLKTHVPLKGSYWLVHSLIIKGTYQSTDTQLQKLENVICDEKGILVQTGPKQSPVISAVKLLGDAKNKPWVFENSNGDLWFTTWGDNDVLYTSWGDGLGLIDKNKSFTDMGIGQLSGLPNAFSGKNVFKDEVPVNPTDAFAVNDKPSSLIYLNNQLIGQFHRPLEDPNIGYLAVSTDGGATWSKDYQTPWTKEVQSPFRCMFFINQGQNYGLNQDGYVYAFGIGKEWGWTGGVYLTRVKVEQILSYRAYEYFSGLNPKTSEPQWTADQQSAQPIDGLFTSQQFSAIYHPGIQRYVAMTNQWIFDAPTPWGPWTVCDKWLQTGWLGYQPGIISKNTGDLSFWFTESGQPEFGDELPYKLCTGQIEFLLTQ